MKTVDHKMFTFIVISSIDIKDDIYYAFSQNGLNVENVSDRMFTEASGGMVEGWIACEYIADIRYDYDKDEIEEIHKTISNPYFYLVEGRNGELNFASKFIIDFKPSCPVLVDNDHGMIAKLIDVKNRIKTGKDWLYSIY